MADLVAKLGEIENKASAIHAKGNTKAVETLSEGANEVELAQSGSWLGYQSCVDYEKLQRPPMGAFFDRQWGLQGRHSSRTIVERTFAWLMRYRRDSRDYMRTTESSEAILQLSMINLMSRRLARLTK